MSFTHHWVRKFWVWVWFLCFTLLSSFFSNFDMKQTVEWIFYWFFIIFFGFKNTNEIQKILFKFVILGFSLSVLIFHLVHVIFIIFHIACIHIKFSPACAWKFAILFACLVDTYTVCLKRGWVVTVAVITASRIARSLVSDATPCLSLFGGTSAN